MLALLRRINKRTAAIQADILELTERVGLLKATPACRAASTCARTILNTVSTPPRPSTPSTPRAISSGRWSTGGDEHVGPGPPEKERRTFICINLKYGKAVLQYKMP